MKKIQRQGDWETGRLGDWETRRRRAVVSVSPCLRVCLLGLFLLGAASGCTWDRFNWFGRESSPSDAPASTSSQDRWNWFGRKAPPTYTPADQLVLRGDQLEKDRHPIDPKAAAQLAAAKELFRRGLPGDYVAAEKDFHRIAEPKKNSSVQIAEEARYYEAECLRLQDRLPKAAETYMAMLTEFPMGIHREEANQHLFDIANFWLDDTREELREEKERRAGKRWLVWPRYMHWDKKKPLFDEEGWAMQKLEQVALQRHHRPAGGQDPFPHGQRQIPQRGLPRGRPLLQPARGDAQG